VLDADSQWYRGGVRELVRGISFTCLTVGTIAAISSCTVPVGTPPPFDESEIRAAYDYVRNLPSDQRIITWSTSSRTYAVVGQSEQSSALVDAYFSAGRRPFFATRVNAFPDIAIAFSSSTPGDAQENPTPAAVKLTQLARDYIASPDASHTGCRALRDTSSDWILLGVGDVASANLLSTDQSGQECTYAILDYLNGFPISGSSFTSDDKLPASNVRNVVMWAIWKCSFIKPADEATNRQTREGNFPYPSVGCVLNMLSHWQDR